jgi:hypothetical protein
MLPVTALIAWVGFISPNLLDNVCAYEMYSELGTKAIYHKAGVNEGNEGSAERE